MGTVLKRKMGAIVRPLPVRDIFGDVFPALIVSARIPVFAVAAAMHILAAVGAGICSLHFYSFKIYLVAAFKTKMMPLFDFWYVHLGSLF